MTHAQTVDTRPFFLGKGVGTRLSRPSLIRTAADLTVARGRRISEKFEKVRGHAHYYVDHAHISFLSLGWQAAYQAERLPMLLKALLEDIISTR